jgi:hypothetical protein
MACSAGQGHRVSIRFFVAAAEPESPAHDQPGLVQDGGVVVQDEVGVSGQDDPVQFEGEQVRVLAGGKLLTRRPR